MFIRRTLCVVSFLAFLALQPIAARAASPGYDAIYAFGDSYCDVGNIYAATDFTYPPAPYFEGRFSNGPIWLDHIASAWGLPLTASSLGGTDYAVGGAYVTSDQSATLGSFSGVIPSVPHQVAEYLLQHGGHADPNALYVIEGGGNDILGASNVTPDYLGYQIALGISESELLLRRAGARNFLIPDLLDVGQLPAAAADPSFATAASVAANNALNIFLGFEDLLEGIRIHRLDVFSLFHAIKADSTPLTIPPSTLVSHFGFTNITTPCLDPTPCADPDHTLFWDAEHPTEFGHSFFAVMVITTLTP